MGFSGSKPLESIGQLVKHKYWATAKTTWHEKSDEELAANYTSDACSAFLDEAYADVFVSQESASVTALCISKCVEKFLVPTLCVALDRVRNAEETEAEAEGARNVELLSKHVMLMLALGISQPSMGGVVHACLSLGADHDVVGMMGECLSLKVRLCSVYTSHSRWILGGFNRSSAVL
ncbi:hypothetical protein KIPB_010726 [Kipferlia bialata]|uniref:Uncharacterized protein n=1 Tax=Kipferlia bialata TaxID=797122 RepID=A0A391P633_9EUKA|nr:hypothetical protein KIPB_010726 [Kipferlia bialata]|eukprot:g10726.t1